MAEMLHEIQIDATPDKVFGALTTEEGLKGWWTADSKAEPRVGTLATFGFYKRKLIFKMRVVELVSGKLVRWHCEGDWEEWIGTKLRFDLERHGEKGTLVRFNHAGWLSTRGVFSTCNTTWGALMVLLKKYSEGMNPGPYFVE